MTNRTMVNSSEELASIVYDTLMKNTGEQYPQFEPNDILDQELNGRVITFRNNGSDYKITVEKTS